MASFPNSRSNSNGEPLIDQRFKQVIDRRGKELIGFGLLAAAAFLSLVLLSWNAADPGWMTATDAPVNNAFGRFGAAIASPLMVIVGKASWGLALALAVWGVRHVLHRGDQGMFGRIVFIPIAVALTALWLASLVPGAAWAQDFGLGGMFGDTLLGAVLTVLPVSGTFGFNMITLITFGMTLAMWAFVLGSSPQELSCFAASFVTGLILTYAGLVAAMNGTARGMGSAAQGAAGAIAQKRAEAQISRAARAEAQQQQAAEAARLHAEAQADYAIRLAEWEAQQAAAAQPQRPLHGGIDWPAADEPLIEPYRDNAPRMSPPPSRTGRVMRPEGFTPGFAPAAAASTPMHSAPHSAAAQPHAAPAYASTAHPATYPAVDAGHHAPQFQAYEPAPALQTRGLSASRSPEAASPHPQPHWGQPDPRANGILAKVSALGRRLAEAPRAFERAPEPELVEPPLSAFAEDAEAPEAERIRSRISDVLKNRSPIKPVIRFTRDLPPLPNSPMQASAAPHSAAAPRLRTEPTLTAPRLEASFNTPANTPASTPAGLFGFGWTAPLAASLAPAASAMGQAASALLRAPNAPEAPLAPATQQAVAPQRSPWQQAPAPAPQPPVMPFTQPPLSAAPVQPEVQAYQPMAPRAPAPETALVYEPARISSPAPEATRYQPAAPAQSVPVQPLAARQPAAGYYADEADYAEEEDFDDGHDISIYGAPPAPLPSSTPAASQGLNRRVVQPQGKKPQPSMRARAEAQPSLQFEETHPGFELPPLSLLSDPNRIERFALSDEALEENARMLESVLDDYGVRGEIVAVRPGPVVTLYELEPAAGLKASRVIGLADDIARSMSALSARVSTVPGRSVIGIELPNAHREKVLLREILAARDFGDTQMRLPLALGKDIGGEAVVANLAKMPHLLIAGTTGSGKSVAINTMILSLLYKLTPAECRLIMIDPKMLELSVYDGIPHLLSPVVTDPKKAVVALKWVVGEMEERYRKMSKMGVRNIEGYNGRVREALAHGEMFKRTVQTGFDDETGDPVFETEEFAPELLPFIVVVVDEMADLMMVAGKEIEACIQRLAQMARASGIHLIMATQRPSVDVITGTIKANFPTRISFQVTSKIDSRTILGEQGAEQLLGMGDMLYMAGGSKITRVHGPFCSDEEVEEVVNHLKSFGPADYVSGVVEGNDGEREADIDAVLGLGNSGGEGSDDALYDQAVAIVARDRKCSTSYIQRKLGIGYNKAARLVEQMETEGVVTPANHVGKREILVPEA